MNHLTAKASASHLFVIVAFRNSLTLMSFLVSDMPLNFTDDMSQEEIERRRADRIARKKAKAKTSRLRRRITKAMHREEKKLF